MMLPAKAARVRRVAEEVTCQNTLQACAPLVRMTSLSTSAITVEADWKIQTALGLPPPSRMSVPVRFNSAGAPSSR